MKKQNFYDTFFVLLKFYFQKIIAATTSNDILLYDYFKFDINDFKSLLDGS